MKRKMAKRCIMPTPSEAMQKRAENAGTSFTIEEGDPLALLYAMRDRTIEEMESAFDKLPEATAQYLRKVWEQAKEEIFARVDEIAPERSDREGLRKLMQAVTARAWELIAPGRPRPEGLLEYEKPKEVGDFAFEITEEGMATRIEDEPKIDSPEMDDRSVVRWMKDTGFFTTAPIAQSKDSGIAALILFETKAQMERTLQHLEGGPDLCWVGYRAPLTGPKDPKEERMKTTESMGLSALAGAEVDPSKPGGGLRIVIVGQSRQGFLLREKSDEVFVEVIDPKQKNPGKRKRIPARTLDGGGVVHLLGKRGKKEAETTLPLFIRQRERRRQKDEAVVIPNRSDHLVRSIISTSGTKLHEEEIRKTIEVLPEAQELGAAKATNLSKWMAKANPAEAYEVTIGLLDESRRGLAAREERDRKNKKRKTRAMVATTLPLPFDETKVEIVVGRAHQQAKDAISDQFFESLQRSLTPSLMQTLLAVFAQAYETGGAFVQNVDALLRLRGSEDGGFQRSKILDELETLGRLEFQLSIRKKDREVGDRIAYRWITYPVLRRGVVKGRTEADGKSVVDSVKWWIDEDFLGTLQAHRHLTLIDKSLFALDAAREEWEFRLGVTISSRWAKGWLAGEHLCESDGRVEWSVDRLVDAAGLGVTARKWIEKKGVESFRDRLRQALETLQRCGPQKAQAIGGFEIQKDRSGDPLLDRVVVWPTEGQVDSFRERIIGKAEAKAKQKALEAAQEPKKAPRRGRPRKA